jgi:hypothetical protein
MLDIVVTIKFIVVCETMTNRGFTPIFFVRSLIRTQVQIVQKNYNNVYLPYYIFIQDHQKKIKNTKANFVLIRHISSMNLTKII